MSTIREKLERHEPLVGQVTSDPEWVAVRVTDLREIWELAHERVHPPEEEEDEPSVERGYDEMQIRMQCLSLATQVDLGRLHAAQGGQWNSDPVGLAEAYLHFLKEGEKTDGADLGNL